LPPDLCACQCEATLDRNRADLKSYQGMIDLNAW
jgi:hypothetical protein